MANSILGCYERKQYEPASLLWALYQPEKAPYRFQAQDIDQAREWQELTRPALSNAVGFQDLPEVPLQPRVIEEVDKGDYIREKILIMTSPWSVMPVYVLRPKQSGERLPVVLAFHGHGYGVKDMIGLWEDGSERDTPEGYHKDFAVALCRRGFLVAAPEISCFGERQTDFAYLQPMMGREAPSTCQHTAALAFHLGGSVAGLRVHDGVRLVDYLETRPDADTSRIGAMGISGGGMHTFFSACLDQRIRACVISGYFCPWRKSIYAMHHCRCNYIPGLAQFGEIYDLAGLLAPRPILIEAGTHDSIFPQDGVQEAVERARQVYGVFGASDQIETDYFEGRHQISGRRAYDFLHEKLG